MGPTVRLFLKTFLVWLATIILVLLLNEVIIEHQSAKDISGFLVTTFGYLLLLSFLIYLPALRLLTRRYKEKYFTYYPVICGLLLNIPFYIFSYIVIGIAFKATEAMLFDGMFTIVGFYFGFAYRKMMTDKNLLSAA